MSKGNETVTETQNITENLEIMLGTSPVQIGVNVSNGISRVADQRAAAQSIVTLDALENQRKQVKKHLKALGEMGQLGVLNGDDAIRIEEALNQQDAISQGYINQLSPIMEHSTAFSVPVAEGTTITPSSFVRGGSKLRKDTVAAAQVILAS